MTLLKHTLSEQFPTEAGRPVITIKLIGFNLDFPFISRPKYRFISDLSSDICSVKNPLRDVYRFEKERKGGEGDA